MLADISFLVNKITFAVAEIIYKEAVIMSSVANIIYVVGEITFKVAVITSLVSKISSCVAKVTFVVGQITFKVASVAAIRHPACRVYLFSHYTLPDMSLCLPIWDPTPGGHTCL